MHPITVNSVYAVLENSWLLILQCSASVQRFTDDIRTVLFIPLDIFVVEIAPVY